MNKRFSLEAQKRTDTQHRSRFVRKNNQIPGSVYGKNKKSVSVSVDKDAFLRVYKEAKETNLVDLIIDGEKHTVLIHSVQVHPVTKNYLHIEFFQANLTEKLKTHVPIKIIGESPAVINKEGVLLHLVGEIEIETLPTSIPSFLEIDISTLTQVNQEIKASNLTPPDGVEILTPKEVAVVKIGALAVQEKEETPTSTEAAPPETPKEGASTETPPVSEQPSEK